MNNYNDTQIESLLKKELTKCCAPVTGYCVVTAIITEKDIYFEHNYEEKGSVVFKHAEVRALEKILKKERSPIIKKIFMLGGGVIKKIKYYTPCYDCTHKLADYVSTDTTVTLFPLPTDTDQVIFSFKELIESYSDAPYSKFVSTNKIEIKTEIIEKTLLKGTDIDFVADLIMLGLENKIKFYLTGSSTGRGGVCRLLMKKTGTDYNDIDIIVVINADQYKKVIEDIEKTITLHYGKYSKNERVVPAHQNKLGVVLGKVYYNCGKEDKKLIDFTFSTSFEGSLSYHAYKFKNWFHQLS